MLPPVLTVVVLAPFAAEPSCSGVLSALSAPDGVKAEAATTCEHASAAASAAAQVGRNSFIEGRLRGRVLPVIDRPHDGLSRAARRGGGVAERLS